MCGSLPTQRATARTGAEERGRIHARDLAGESPGQVWAGENPHDVAARRAGGIGPSRLLHPALLRQPARRALVKSSRKPVASSDMRPEVGGCRAPRVRRWAGPPPPAPRRTPTACPIRRCRDGHRWRRPRVVVVHSSGKCPRRTAGRRAPTANPRGRCRPTARFSAPTPKLLVRAGHEPGPHRSPTTGRALRGGSGGVGPAAGGSARPVGSPPDPVVVIPSWGVQLLLGPAAARRHGAEHPYVSLSAAPRLSSPPIPACYSSGERFVGAEPPGFHRHPARSAGFVVQVHVPVGSAGNATPPGMSRRGSCGDRPRRERP